MTIICNPFYDILLLNAGNLVMFPIQNDIQTDMQRDQIDMQKDKTDMWSDQIDQIDMQNDQTGMQNDQIDMQIDMWKDQTDMWNDQIDMLNGIDHVPQSLDALVAGTETTGVCVEVDHVLAHRHHHLYNKPEVIRTIHGSQHNLT